VVAVYFAIPYRFRWVLLLCASYYFYICWKPVYALLLFLSTFVVYYAGIQMGKTEIKSKRKKFLILSLFSNLGLLFLFKYYHFFNDSLRTLFAQYNLFYGIPALKFLLPVGISFYTFKSLSYSIDVYRGNQAPEKHLGIFALYVAFFPQLLAGPIERSTRLLPQLRKAFYFDYQRVTEGAKLIFWGLFQKVVVADTLSTLVDSVYDKPTQYTGISFAVATVFFAFQIYCDFSGYSDIAIGAAQILGYRTMENFNRPYFSKSIAEFWRRWHISLSSWFRDYLYIPLGGNRVSIPRGYLNLLVVFLLCGLWHGANWTFVIWGGLHGGYLVFSNVTQRARERVVQKLGLENTPRLSKSLKVLTTFIFVCFAWIFFRSNSVSDAFYIVSHLLTGWETVFNMETLRDGLSLGPSRFQWIVGTASIGLVLFVQLLQRQGRVIDQLSKKPVWLRWSIYYAMISIFLLCGSLQSKEFIYFQF
jgi:D-alanyl-lipoteichoic acid acyltransferase DltB (MBOAT superfamily)